MAVVGFMIFTSALGASIAVFWLTLAPAMPRIVALLRDGVDPMAPRPAFAIVAEPRNRVRARTTTFVAQSTWRVAA